MYSFMYLAFNQLGQFLDVSSQFVYLLLIASDHVLHMLQSVLSLLLVLLTFHKLDSLLHGVQPHHFGEPTSLPDLL